MPAALGVCAVLASAAHAQASAAETSPTATVATITPLFSPDRLGAEGSLSFTLDFADSHGGVPAPLSRSILRLPVGVTL